MSNAHRTAAPGSFRDVEVTYPEIGATRVDPMPSGYRRLHRTGVVGRGGGAFLIAADALLTWRLHRAAGLRPVADHATTEPDAVVVLTIGLRPLAFTAACRVVYTVDEPGRRGFAYGTLPGHPETGEEAFLLDLQPDGTVTFTVRTFSRPAALLPRLGTPFTYLAQEIGVRHYLATMRRVVAG